MENGGRNPNTQCYVCAKPIYKRPWELQRYKSVYCSLACYHSTIRPISKRCPICQQDFKPWRPIAKTCSRSCANISRRGGKYSKESCGNYSRHNLETLKLAFDFQECMIVGCSYKKTFDIHRLISGKSGGKYEIGNMYAICPDHHAEVSRGSIALEKIADDQLRIM